MVDLLLRLLQKNTNVTMHNEKTIILVTEAVNKTLIINRIKRSNLLRYFGNIRNKLGINSNADAFGS